MTKTEQSEPAQAFAASKSALARDLKIGRQALDRYLHLLGAPVKAANGWPTAEVKAWILSNADRTDIIGRLDPEMKRLRQIVLKEKVRAARMRNDLEEGILIRKDWSDADISRRLRGCQAVLARIPSRMAVEIPGLTVAEAQARLEQAIGEALAKLAEPPIEQ